MLRALSSKVTMCHVSVTMLIGPYKSHLEHIICRIKIALEAVSSTATLPLMVRPTHESYMTEADVFVDLVHMQAALPLIDADMAVAECGKCNKAVDRLGYHAAFCSSTYTYIHYAVVNELTACLSSAGASVLLEPLILGTTLNVLPHTHSLDQTA